MRISILLFVLMATCSLRAEKPQAVKNALYNGADTKVVFRIVDDEGKPVKDACVNVGFDLHRDPGNPKAFKFTDKDGVCVLQGKSAGSLTYSVKKEGYYRSRETISFVNRGNWEKCLKDGKWLPYGDMRTVVLKPIKKPLSHRAYYYKKSFERTDLPIVDLPMAFDLKVGDFLPPYGKGVETDFVMTYQEIDGKWRCLLSFPRELDGVYVNNCDAASDFPTEYHANTNAIYKKEISFDYGAYKQTLPENKYLVLRTRTKVNEKGELTEAYYSKICGGMNVSRYEIKIKYYRNPEKNSTNLEFEPKYIWEDRPLP